ncbi:hypothetical protein KBD81_03850 [Candidatus Woesebacteria bacterium]|nr:hypothetical protein [Candidatus Woesebacteria bacterium]
MKNNLLAVTFVGPTGAIEFREDINHETIWANLQEIADLFQTDKSGISRHIRNIYDSEELDRHSTVAKFATVQNEGKRLIKQYAKKF